MRNRDVLDLRNPQVRQNVMQARINMPLPGAPIPTYLKEPGKPMELNPLKRYAQPFTLTTEPEIVEVLPGRSSDPIPLPISNRGSYEIKYSFMTISVNGIELPSFDPTNYLVEVLLLDPSKRPFLMNEPINARTFCSRFGGTPFVWPESFFMNVEDSGKALFAMFRVIETGADIPDPDVPIQIRFALHGTRYYFMQAPQKIQDQIMRRCTRFPRTFPYFWTPQKDIVLEALNDPSGDDYKEVDIRVTDEADAEIFKISKASIGVDLDPIPFVTVNPPFSITFDEKAEDRPLMTGPIHSTLLGNAEFPFLLFEPLFLEGNSQLRVGVQNLLTIRQRVWLTFAGRKLLHGERREPSKPL